MDMSINWFNVTVIPQAGNEVSLVLIHGNFVLFGQQTKWIFTLTNHACELSNNQYILSFAVSPTGSD